MKALQLLLLASACKSDDPKDTDSPDIEAPSFGIDVLEWAAIGGGEGSAGAMVGLAAVSSTGCMF